VIGSSKSGATLPCGTATVALDIANEPLPAALFEGVDIVVHLAGIAHQRASGADYEQVVTGGTRRLAEAAAAAGVQHFLYLSSVKAMGAPTSRQPRSEHETNAVLTPYGAAKRAAETALRGVHEQTRLSVTVLRPALIYGDGARGNLPMLERAVRLGLPRPPEMGRRSMLSLNALLRLIAALVEAPLTGLHTFIVCDDAPYSTAQVYDQLRFKRGLSPRRSWTPAWLWRALAAALDTVQGQGAEPTFEKLFGNEVYSNAAVRRATGWQPGTVLTHRAGQQ
jgi:nucleoside-diphosphate-sugar epimerase